MVLSHCLYTHITIYHVCQSVASPFNDCVRRYGRKEVLLYMYIKERVDCTLFRSFFGMIVEVLQLPLDRWWSISMVFVEAETYGCTVICLFYQLPTYPFTYLDLDVFSWIAWFVFTLKEMLFWAIRLCPSQSLLWVSTDMYFYDFEDRKLSIFVEKVPKPSHFYEFPLFWYAWCKWWQP